MEEDNKKVKSKELADQVRKEIEEYSANISRIKEDILNDTEKEKHSFRENIQIGIQKLESYSAIGIEKAKSLKEKLSEIDLHLNMGKAFSKEELMLQKEKIANAYKSAKDEISSFDKDELMDDLGKMLESAAAKVDEKMDALKTYFFKGEEDKPVQIAAKAADGENKKDDDSILDKIEDTFEDISDKVEDMADDMEDSFDELVDDAKEVSIKAKAQLKVKAEAYKKELEELLDKLDGDDDDKEDGYFDNLKSELEESYSDVKKKFKSFFSSDDKEEKSKDEDKAKE